MRIYEFISEAAYTGNIGMMEMWKFFQVATPRQQDLMRRLLAQHKENQAWELLKNVTGVKLRESFSSDIPSQSWLQGKQEYAQQRGRNSYGVPYMGTMTGTFSEHVTLPVALLRQLPGMRGEQKNVRKHDLDAIKKIMQSTGRLPQHNGHDYVPFINVAWNGEAWVNEGNHRIMAAAELGWPELPVEVRYFDGGELADGPLNPKKLRLHENTDLDEDLRKWFREKWVRFNPQGKIMGPCARGSDREGKPKCLPQSKAHALGKKGRASAAARKRREDPNPERRGAATNVATRKKK